MNNLKFRAYFEQYERMIDNIGIINQNMILVDFTNSGELESIFITDKIHVMQSTGLFDKCGVEIYEGDIIDVGTIIPFLNKIQRDEETAYLKLVPLDKRWTESYFTNFEDKSRYEVIGNIYENKELLG